MPVRKRSEQSFQSKLKNIRMVIMDVDGVMSDGRIIVDDRGIEYKSFDTHDGYGIARAREHGILFAIISGRESKAVAHRAKRLKIDDVYLNTMDKVSAYVQLKKKYRLNDEEVCYIGDDEFDLPLLEIVGVSVAPANAMALVKKRVGYVTARSGGKGAVRELLDRILKAKSLL